MKFVLTVMLIVMVTISLVGCGKRTASTAKQQDIVDSDFVATIQKTALPDIFEVAVKKTNSKTDKGIGSFPVIVDLTLKSTSGKVYTGESLENRVTPVYAKEVGFVFGDLREPRAKSVTGRVRLLTDKLPPGSYTIQP